MIPAIGRTSSIDSISHQEDGRTSPVPQNILESIGAGVRGLDSNLLRQVVSLERPQQQSRPSSITDDPREFFSVADMPEMADFFNETDIKLIKNLFQKNSITSFLCFHDLFGFEFFQILEQLRPFFKKGQFNELRGEWVSLYSKGYIGLLRKSAGASLNESEIPCLEKQVYQNAFNSFKSYLELILSEKKGNAEVFQDVLTRWSETQSVFEKFLNNDATTALLSDHRLNIFPGAKNLDDYNPEQAFFDFKSYVQLIKASLPSKFFSGFNEQLDSLQIGSEVSVYQEVLQEVLDEIPAVMKNGPLLLNALDLAQNGHLNYARWCEVHQIPKRDQIKLSQEEFIENLVQDHLLNSLTVCWAIDLKTIMEGLILVRFNSVKSSFAYCNRSALNLCSTLSWAGSYNTKLDEGSALNRHLLGIELHTRHLIKNSSIAENFRKVAHLHQSPGFSPFSSKHSRMERELYEAIYDSLVPVIDETLQMLGEIPASECKGHPLIDKTIFLSRILLLFHDIGASIERQEPSEDNILPPSFLEFLSYEEGMTELASAPPEALFLPEVAGLTLEEMAVSDVRAILGTKKRRHLEVILRKLGLEPVSTKDRGKGSHTVWKDEDGGRTTVVPRGHNGEISEGTRRAIHDQVNATSAVTKPRKNRKKKR